MRWRCEWCGKPHDENDPPCDNCGHGKFEEAVVQQTDLAEESGPEETKVWVCTECGRNHTKHAPPCSRCGNHKLVLETQRVSEDELVAKGYLDLLTPKTAASILLGVVLLAVFVAGLLGVVHIPGFGTKMPTIENVPGDEESAGNISLRDVEASYLEDANSARETLDEESLSREEELDELARLVTRREVKDDYTDESVPSNDRIRDVVSNRCDGGWVVGTVSASGDDYASAQGLGNALVVQATQEGTVGSDPGTKTGLHAHTAPDGTVYLTQVIC